MGRRLFGALGAAIAVLATTGADRGASLAFLGLRWVVLLHPAR
jgi:hypothetical protein